MVWRYNTPDEGDKNQYYELMKTALETGEYAKVFDFADTYIQEY